MISIESAIWRATAINTIIEIAINQSGYPNVKTQYILWGAGMYETAEFKENNN